MINKTTLISTLEVIGFEESRLDENLYFYPTECDDINNSINIDFTDISEDLFIMIFRKALSISRRCDYNHHIAHVKNKMVEAINKI